MHHDGLTTTLACVDQLNTRGRYLFIVSNNTYRWFSLAEVEVFNGRLLDSVSINVASETNCDQIIIIALESIF